MEAIYGMGGGGERSGTSTPPSGYSYPSSAKSQEDSSPVPAACLSATNSPGSVPHSSLGSLHSSSEMLQSTAAAAVDAKSLVDSAPTFPATSSSWNQAPAPLAPAAAAGAAVGVPRVVSTVMPSPSSDPSLDDDSQTLLQQQRPQSSRSTPTSPRKAEKTTPARRKQTSKISEGGPKTVNRRQKRLERNRESARLSRRRRKQYLEILEDRVTKFSHDMDKGRREHVKQAVATIEQKRTTVLNTSHYNASAKAQALLTNLSRTSNELRVASTFRIQQLKSFVLPPSIKFIMWLTLQTDTYFRGGRAASERLSAARIGERLLNSGTGTVPPSESMWPLFCSEVGLSYEQEERVRNFQRTILQMEERWLDRHTAFAAGKVLQSVHDSIQAVTHRVGQREAAGLSVLSDEQKIKFLSWANSRKEKNPVTPPAATPLKFNEKFQTSDSQHVAANLYVLNYRLQSLMTKVPPLAAPLVPGPMLKKLARRPSFESLGPTAESKKEMSREDSVASLGSLKRSSSDMSLEDNGGEESDKPQTPTVKPVDAMATFAPAIEKTLGAFKEIMPRPNPAGYAIPIPSPTPVASFQAAAPMVVAAVAPHPMMPAAVQVPVVPVAVPSVPPPPPPPTVAPPPPAAAAAQQHVRKSSFLPAHLNVVPEEMWPAEEEADDFLMSLVDGDWAIGEGVDMELDS